MLLSGKYRSSTVSEISWGAPGRLALFQGRIERRPGLAPPPAVLTAAASTDICAGRHPKKTPLARGVGRLLVCGGVSFSLLSG